MDTYYSVPEAARQLGLAPSTLRWQIKNGKFRAIKVSRDWYVTPAEIARYRAENKRGTK